MSIERKDEYVCFQQNPSGSPMLLLAGHRFRPGPQGKIVRTPNYYLFHYIIEGAGQLSGADGRQETVRAGDWFFAFPGQTISYQQDPEKPWTYYWLGFQGEDLDFILARAGISSETLLRRQSPDPASMALLESLLGILKKPSLTSSLEVKICLMNIFCRLIKTAPARDRQQAQAVIEDDNDPVELACRFMAEHYNEGITVNEVSNYIGLERSYFSKCFSKKTGATVRDYLNRIRLSRAKELLKKNKLSIAEIAAVVGYVESRTFSHFFKKQTGLSPQKWQESEM